MTGTAFALSSALLYGIVDFVGGRISKQISGIAFALYVQMAGFAAVLALLPIAPGAFLQEDLGWGALSGLGSGIAILFLYTGMGKGKISLVVPVVAVVGAAIPVLIGILIHGERPEFLTLCGVLLVFPAIWMVSGAGRADDGRWMAGLSDCFIAGLGVAIQYTAMASVSGNSIIWPLLANRAVSIVFVFFYAGISRDHLHIPAGYLRSALWIGAVASGSLALYMLATQFSMLTIAVVLSSLYPVIPTILAIYLLKERVSDLQRAGLVCAAIAVTLITI